MKLPGWCVDNRTAVRRDVEPYMALAAGETWPMVVQAAMLGSAQLQWDPHSEEARAWRDPLPKSTLATLARLRGHYAGQK